MNFPSLDFEFYGGMRTAKGKPINAWHRQQDFDHGRRGSAH
jgi:hypothetical protein